MNFEEIKEFLPWSVTFLISLYALNKERINNMFAKEKKSIEVRIDGENLESSSLNNVEQSVRILKDLLGTNKEFYEYRINDINTHFEELIGKLKTSLDSANELYSEQLQINKDQQVINANYKNIIRSYERKYGRLEETKKP